MIAAVVVIIMAAAGCGAAEPAGPPAVVKLLTYSDYTLRDGTVLTRYGAQARAADINAHGGLNAFGGVNGHTIDLITCDTEQDPAVLTECVQGAVDQGVVAVVGGSSMLDPLGSRITAAAGVPQIGFAPSSPEGFDSPMTLCLGTSDEMAVRGAAASLARQGATRSTIVLPASDPASARNAERFAEAAREYGMTTGRPVLHDDPVTDWAQVVSEATRGGTDGVALGIGSTVPAAVEQLAATPGLRFAIPGTGLTESDLTALADIDARIPVVDLVKPATADTAGGRQFLADMKTHHPDSTNLSTRAVMDWIGMSAFEQIAATITGPITRDSVADAMFSMPTLDTGGLTPRLNTSRRGAGGQGACVVNTSVALNAVVDGEVFEDRSGFLDVLSNQDVR